MASTNRIRKNIAKKTRAASKKGVICWLGNKAFCNTGTFKHRVITIKTDGKFNRERKIIVGFWPEATNFVKTTRKRKESTQTKTTARKRYNISKDKNDGWIPALFIIPPPLF